MIELNENYPKNYPTIKFYTISRDLAWDDWIKNLEALCNSTVPNPGCLLIIQEVVERVREILVDFA